MQIHRLLPALTLVLAPVLLLGPVREASAGELPRAQPAEVGLDATALEKIDRTVNGMIEQKQLPGAVVAVAREGKVAYMRSFGAFKKDSIFRIYSMSKPITVAAALLLVDEGKLSLDDPVAKHLPAYANVKVYGSEEPATPITIRHLMQHTAGQTYGLFSNTPVDTLMRKADVLDKDGTLAEASAKLAALPLLYEPGTRWHYSVSIDLLGHIIEVVAKQPFDVFLRERLFTPLGMVDTGFFVPEAKRERFLPNYTMRSMVIEPVEGSAFNTNPTLLSGGGGLVSTTSDYMRFALMLAAGGVHEGKRIVSAKRVQQMVTNQLPKALVPIAFGNIPWPGVGFGLGVSVRVAEAGPGTRVGTWGWAGAASTFFSVSPSDKTVILTMIQRMPLWNGLDRAIRPLVYASITPAAAATTDTATTGAASEASEPTAKPEAAKPETAKPEPVAPTPGR